MPACLKRRSILYNITEDNHSMTNIFENEKDIDTIISNSFENSKAKDINHIYRDYLPNGKYDMVIISLVHQDLSMIQYMASNIKRFVNGSFLWIIHANGGSFNENDLPPWVWLSRHVINTIHHTTTLVHAISACIDFAIKNIEFINCMFISSGSVFFREYIVPTKECVSALSHETIFFPDKNFTYTNPIPIEYLGKCADYLIQQGGTNYNGWQYKNYSPYGMDLDEDIQNIIKKRNVLFIKGSHIPGQVFPYTVCKMLVEDLGKYFSRPNIHTYCLEEILPSTYSYWYAQENNISIQKNVVYMNWIHNYNMDSIQFIEELPSKCPDAYAITKVSYDLNSTVRKQFA